MTKKRDKKKQIEKKKELQKKHEANKAYKDIHGVKIGEKENRMEGRTNTAGMRWTKKSTETTTTTKK
jgi:hypothetical protein